MTTKNEVEIACEVRRETDSAYLINDGTREAWIPKSQVSDVEETSEGVVTSIFIPEWLAEREELI